MNPRNPMCRFWIYFKCQTNLQTALKKKKKELSFCCCTVTQNQELFFAPAMARASFGTETSTSRYKMDPRHRSLWFCYFSLHIESSTDRLAELCIHRPFARSSQWKHENWECMHKEVKKLTENQLSFSTYISLHKL